MANYQLTAEPRDLTGRKVKQLRSRGVVPANLFGSQVQSVSFQLPVTEFLKVYKTAGDTGLIDLTISGEKQSRPVLVHEVQSHPVTAQLLHVDFRQVNLKEKLTAEVPVKLTGEAPAVATGGILVQVLDTVSIEALPADLPEALEIDVATLAEIGQTLTVAELKFDKSKLTLQNEPDTVIAKIDAPAAEEEQPTPDTVAEHGGEDAAAEGETSEESAGSSDQPTSETPAE